MTRIELERLACLASLNIHEEEATFLLESLEKAVQVISQLNDLPELEGVQPWKPGDFGQHLPFRQDNLEETSEPKKLLALSGQTSEHLYLVPSVLDQSS